MYLGGDLFGALSLLDLGGGLLLGALLDDLHFSKTIVTTRIRLKNKLKNNLLILHLRTKPTNF